MSGLFEFVGGFIIGVCIGLIMIALIKLKEANE